MPIGKFIIDHLRRNGFKVRCDANDRATTYVAEKDGETFMVRTEDNGEDDHYRAVCELALKCGIDLEDG